MSVAPSQGERLLAAAIGQIRRHGAKRVTVVSVAAEAGMTHANVYRYYASKAALFDAVSTAWLKRIEDQIRDISDSPDPAHDKLERIVLTAARAYRNLAEADPEVFELFVEAYAKGRPAARRHRARLRDLLERVIDEGVSGGAFQLARGPALALILDASHRFWTPPSIRADRDQPPASIERRLELILRGALAVIRRG